MTERARVYANLSTLANALVGVGAIAYALAGNKLWAMLLIVAGVGFDGLDGQFARRGGAPGGLFGRVADSLADAITFGAAPAAILIVHTDNPLLWRPWLPAALGVGILVGGLAIARLTYFTLRAYQLPHFLGAPSPQTAIAIVLIVLSGDVPPFWGTNPPFVLAASALVALLMVVPVRFPKIRRDSRLRVPMTVTGLALVLAILPLQFRPAVGSVLYTGALVAALVASVGVAIYYLLGPSTVPPYPGSGPTVPAGGGS